MEVLELPNAVISFMRSISKEIDRYTLFWDINGTDESIGLSLKWKLNIDKSNEDLCGNHRKYHKQKLKDLNLSTDSSNTDSSLENDRKNLGGTIKNNVKNQRKFQKQMQHYKLDSIKNEFKENIKHTTSKSFQRMSYLPKREDQFENLIPRRHLSAESVHFENKLPQSEEKMNSNYNANTLPSRGRSLENYKQFIKKEFTLDQLEKDLKNVAEFNNRNRSQNSEFETPQFNQSHVQDFRRVAEFNNNKRNKSQNLEGEIPQFNQSHVQDFKSTFQKNYSNSLTRNFETIDNSPVDFQTMNDYWKYSEMTERKPIVTDFFEPLLWVKRKSFTKKDKKKTDRNFSLKDASEHYKQYFRKIYNI